MRRNFLLVVAIAVMSAMFMVGCAWDSMTDTAEMRKLYSQIDSKKDSVNILRTTRSGVAGKNAPDSISCSLDIDGKVIVDGGSTSDLTNTYVTVEKVIVKVWKDGYHTPVEYVPELDKEVAEPSNTTSWNMMPQGVKYSRKALCGNPVTFTYKDYFYVEVNVCYVLRVRDDKLAAGCTLDHYWCKAVYSSTNMMETEMRMLVPLELTTICFHATVDTYK